MTTVAIVVRATPAPKGSEHAFFRPGMKRAVIIPDNSTKQRSWKRAVRDAAIEVMSVDGEKGEVRFVEVALEVTIVFGVLRPAGHFGTGKNAAQLKPSAPKYPAKKPDLDKLARSTLDALSGIVFDDDARISRLILDKLFAAPGHEGATIVVREREAPL